MLTAKQIIEKNIIFLTDEAKNQYSINKLSPAQVGIDLHIVSCSKLISDNRDIGHIYSDSVKDKKTKITKTSVCIPVSDKENNTSTWILDKGVYEIGFAEGCNFDSKTFGKIVHRSSLYRNGVEINSPIWDPGFHTNEMGTFMIVHNPIRIDLFARVAQIIVFETSEEAEKYDGQYQGTGVLNGNH